MCYLFHKIKTLYPKLATYALSHWLPVWTLCCEIQYQFYHTDPSLFISQSSVSTSDQVSGANGCHVKVAFNVESVKEKAIILRNTIVLISFASLGCLSIMDKAFMTSLPQYSLWKQDINNEARRICERGFFCSLYLLVLLLNCVPHSE